MAQAAFDCDFLVIGSGFGGSVSAMRLTEKGYKVIIAEQGKHYSADNMPKTVRQFDKFFWFKPFKLKGFFAMDMFRHVMVLHGNAVGGGSITYGNTLLVPKDEIWHYGNWKGLHDWVNIMPEHYRTAKRMLGVTQNQLLGNADNVLYEMAKEVGREETFYRTDVAVYFGDEDEHTHAPIEGDPYFHGEGPARDACIGCGGCMAGCRYNAKNSLDKNYLYFAQKNGAKLLAETEVIDILPLGDKQDGSEGYEVRMDSVDKGKYSVFTREIVLSASSLGTQKMLFEQRRRGHLPNVSQQLGKRLFTNAEALLGVRFYGESQGNMSDGIAIGSGMHLDDDTHIEVTRYSDGFNLGALLATMSNYKEGRKLPLSKWFLQLAKMLVTNPLKLWRTLRPKNMARESIILLCMQSTPYDLDMVYEEKSWPLSWFGGKYRLQTEGKPIPSFIPVASEFTDMMAKKTGGNAFGMVSEVFLNIPTTAHCMGGVSLGHSAEDGVVDKYHRLFGYEGFYVCDGSNISSNLGVNPSLTITALTEHAMSHVPHKQDNPKYDAGSDNDRAGQSEALGVQGMNEVPVRVYTSAAEPVLDETS